MNNSNFTVPQDFASLDMETVQKIYLMKRNEEALKKLNISIPLLPSKDGYFHIQLKDETRKNGRRHIKAKTREKLIDKVFSILNCIPSSNATFNDIFQIVQEEKLKNAIVPEKKVSVTNTVLRNKSEYKRYFKNTSFEKMPIVEIQASDIESIVVANIREKKLRKKALDSMRAILNSVFKYALYKGIIPDNPYAKIDFRMFSDMTENSVPITERAFNDETVQKILEYLHDYQNAHPRYVVAYALELQILVGLRRGEVPPLKRRDIVQGCLHIHQEQLTVKKTDTEKEHFVIVNHTKTEKNRLYPIAGQVEKFMNRLLKMLDTYYPDSEFLFPAKTENGAMTNNMVYNFYRRTLKKLNIEQPENIIMGTHCFRRNRITDTMNKSNGNAILTASLYGNSPEVIKNHYYLGVDLEEARRVIS